MGIFTVIVGTAIGMWLVHIIARAYFRRFGAVLWQAILVAVPVLIVAMLPMVIMAGLAGFPDAKELGGLPRLGFMLYLLTYSATYRSFKKPTAADTSSDK